MAGQPVNAEVKWSAIQATAHAVLMVPVQGPVKPWLKGGLGVYNAKVAVETDVLGDDDESKSKLGFNFGAGFNWSASSNVSLGVGGAYHIVPTEDDFGADANFFVFGVNLLWGANLATGGGK